MYGVPATPQRFTARHLRPATPIQGLLLCGSDISSLGIIGAMIGGVAAASRAGGSRSFFQIVGRARADGKRGASKHAAAEHAAPSPGKHEIVARLAAKTALTDTIYELEYSMNADLTFTPGQYMKLRVTEDEWREYSIVACRAGKLVFIVQTRSGGPGSRYVLGLQAGEETVMHPPLGDFRLTPATGLGHLSPRALSRSVHPDAERACRAQLHGTGEPSLRLPRVSRKLPGPLHGIYPRPTRPHHDTLHAAKTRATGVFPDV